MMSALLDCFKDESWPVRDCACLACGHFVSAFPEESKTVFEELSKLWIDHLSDNIQSVREHSSQGLTQVLKSSETYKEQISTSITTYITENLLKAKTQEPDSQKHDNLTNETIFGVAKQV